MLVYLFEILINNKQIKENHTMGKLKYEERKYGCRFVKGSVTNEHE